MKRLTGILLIACILIAGCRAGDIIPSEPVTVTPITVAIFGNSGRATDEGAALGTLADVINNTDDSFAVDLGNRLSPAISSAGVDVVWEALDRERTWFDIPVFPLRRGIRYLRFRERYRLYRPLRTVLVWIRP